MAKTLAEEIFGGVSDCKGMGTVIGDSRGKVPVGTETRTPRYHEGEQVDPATVVNDIDHVTPQMLSSHF